MLLPFLMNYLICWYVWVTTDKRKAVTWVAALLSFYPQFVACKIIYLIWSDPKKGLQKKRHLERNMVQMESFCESVPSTLVMTYLLRRQEMGAEGSEIIFDSNNQKDLILFWVAFLTSVITSSLGLAKNPKVGPCRILPEQKKCLGGLLSPRFILIFFACGLSFVAKGFALAAGFATPKGQISAVGGAITICTLFLPGILTGLFASWHKGILKTFLAHPSVFLLPMFTYFTFASSSKICCGREGQTRDYEMGTEITKKETIIIFSPIYTAINASVSFVGLLVYAFTLALIYEASLDRVLPYFGLVFTPGRLLTLATTLSNQCNCCRSCCCSSCCTEPFELGALLTSSPHIPYILGSDGQLKKEGTGGGLKEEKEIIGMGVEVEMEAEEVKEVMVEDLAKDLEMDTSNELS